MAALPASSILSVTARSLFGMPGVNREVGRLRTTVANSLANSWRADTSVNSPWNGFEASAVVSLARTRSTRPSRIATTSGEERPRSRGAVASRTTLEGLSSCPKARVPWAHALRCRGASVQTVPREVEVGARFSDPSSGSVSSQACIQSSRFQRVAFGRKVDSAT